MKAKHASEFAVQPRLRVLAGGEIALGPGKAELLERVRRTGSIREAATGMDMSYMRAWKLIKTMNECFVEPVIVTVRGGSTGGGAKLTDTGVKVLEAYQKMEEIARSKIVPEWRELKKLLRH